MTNLATFVALVLGDALAYEFGLLIALVLLIHLRRLCSALIRRV
jgi:hypothetical protein